MSNNGLIIRCSAFENNEKFPIKYTGYGENISPEFIIDNLSSEAESYIITLEDLNHPIRNFTHWIIWNIPAAPKIPGNIPGGKKIPSMSTAVQGVAYGYHRYAGPKPPKGKKHKYCFTIYALDSYLDLSPLSTKNKVLSKARNHIIQKGTFYSFYE